MEFADQGGQHMGVLQIKIITGSVQVGGHQADGIEAVLLMIGLTHLNARDLGHRIPLIGGLQLTGKQMLFLHGLGGKFWINAGGTKEEELLAPALMGCINDVGLDQEIVADKIGRQAVIGMDAADLCRRKKDILRPIVGKERMDSSLICQVQFSMGAGQDLAATYLFQSTADGGTNQAPVTCNIDDGFAKG